MTRRGRSTHDDPYVNTGDRAHSFDAIIDVSDPHRAGLLEFHIKGQRVVIDGPDCATFDGTLDELCDLLRAAREYERVYKDREEAERELAIAREIHAETEQHLCNLLWINNATRCPVCVRRLIDRHATELPTDGRRVVVRLVPKVSK